MDIEAVGFNPRQIASIVVGLAHHFGDDGNIPLGVEAARHIRLGGHAPVPAICQFLYFAKVVLG